jgi:uncharacterized short protein YbdD (DUF466 family)
MSRFAALCGALAEAGRLMVGQTSYRAYREHMATHHPNAPVMDERAFFRHRQEARYGGRGGGRCC